jgi:hypothetical protein
MSLETLRELAESQGVSPTDEDLEAVRGFLDLLLPALVEIERLLPTEVEQ